MSLILLYCVLYFYDYGTKYSTFFKYDFNIQIWPVFLEQLFQAVTVYCGHFLHWAWIYLHCMRESEIRDNGVVCRINGWQSWHWVWWWSACNYWRWWSAYVCFEYSHVIWHHLTSSDQLIIHQVINDQKYHEKFWCRYS